MKVLKGLKAIGKEVDESADWYKYRRSVCDSCSFNSKNYKPTEAVKDFIISALETIKPLINKEDEDSGNCNLCTCYINKKCNDRLESCPLGKWKALDIQDSNLKIEGIKNILGVEVLSGVSTVYNVYTTDVLKTDILDFELEVKSKNFKLYTAEFGCPCAFLENAPELKNNKTYSIKGKISPANKEVKEAPHRVSLRVTFEQGSYLINIYFKVM